MAKKPKPESSRDRTSRGVDLAEVERLLEFMQKHGLEEFEYERDGVHIRLKKASAQSSGDAAGSGPSGRRLARIGAAALRRPPPAPRRRPGSAEPPRRTFT